MTDPSNLSQMQHWIVQQLQRERMLPKQADAVEGCERYLTGNDRLSPAEQLEIYRVQFWLRHTSALIEDFPGVSGILGQAEWERLVESYLAACPPESWTLRDLGDRLPQHIADRPETPHQALCEDMARLEWFYTELFDAQEVPPLDQAKLMSLPEDAWQSARMVFNPAFRLLQVRYPVAKLRRELRAAEDDADAPAIEIPEEHPQNLVLYRDQQRQLYSKPVSEAAFCLLGKLTAGVPLVPAAEQTVAQLPDAAHEVQSKVGPWFQDWGARGWIVDVQI